MQQAKGATGSHMSSVQFIKDDIRQRQSTRDTEYRWTVVELRISCKTCGFETRESSLVTVSIQKNRTHVWSTLRSRLPSSPCHTWCGWCLWNGSARRRRWVAGARLRTNIAWSDRPIADRRPRRDQVPLARRLPTTARLRRLRTRWCEAWTEASRRCERDRRCLN